MKVLAVEPGKVPYETEIESGLESLQKAVGGSIEAVYPYEDPVAVICNEEGKLMGLPLNRALKDEDGNIYDILAGKFLIAGLGEESFSDLSPDLMAKYKEKFFYPETILHIAGRFVSVKQLVPKEQDTDRITKSSDLADKLDNFFRNSNTGYEDMFPDMKEKREQMTMELLAGNTWKSRMCLAAVAQDAHLEDEEAKFLEQISSYEKAYGISSYSVYQLSLSDSTDIYRFMSYDWLEKKELSVERSNYQMVYSTELTPADTLDTIFQDLNLYHPDGFKGHSLSVSDIVVLHEKGKDTAYYVDSIGFRELPNFLEDRKSQKIDRNVSMREQIQQAKEQAAQTEPKATDKKHRTPERS